MRKLAMTLLLFALVASAAAGATMARPAPSRCSQLGKVRERETLRGVRWLGDYLSTPRHRSGMGSDDYGIFWEVGETASRPPVQKLAIPLARREAGVLYRNLIRGGLRFRGQAFNAATLLPDARALGLPVEPLLGLLRARLRRFHTASALYGVDVHRLAHANENVMFNLLIDSYTLERLRAAFPSAVELRFGLADVLRRWLNRPLVPFARDHSRGKSRFQNDAYWATHVGYVLQDYGQLRLRPSDMAVDWAYLRSQFWATLHWGYEDLIAEFVDVFHSAGVSDRDPEVCAGTLYLLRRQRPNGYWGDGERNTDPYDIVHPAWVAVDALRQRFFLKGTRYARRERAIIRSLR